MVKEVRNVYDGELTYTMNYAHIMNNTDPYLIGSRHLWEDLDLDVVGVSSYFPLVNYEVNGVLSVEYLEERWWDIINKYFIPLKKQNIDKPLVLTEMGFVTAVNAPFDPASEERRDRMDIVLDKDNNGLDDAQEQQANIYRAFFNVMSKNTDIISGAFLWGEAFTENGYIDIWGTRGKLAEQEVIGAYK